MKKFILLTITFFLVFMGIFTITFEHWGEYSGWVKDSDYYFHWSKANGECPTRFYDYEKCVSYSPLYSMITKYFSFSEYAFNVFPMILTIFLIPLVLYRRTKSIFSPLIYFSSAFIFTVFYASIFAHALLSLIFVLILTSKKHLTFWNGALYALSLFTHSQAVYVMLPLFLYKIWQDDGKIISSAFVPTIFFQAKNRMDELTFNHLFFVGFPINWFYSFFLEKSKILLITFFLIGAVAINYRSILFIPLLWSVWLPRYYKKSEHRNLLILGMILFIIVQFIGFYAQTNLFPPIV